MEWAEYAVALMFSVSPMAVQDWEPEDVKDALAVIEELNRDQARRASKRG